MIVVLSLNIFYTFDIAMTQLSFHMDNHIDKVVYVMFVETVSGWNGTSENISKKISNFFLVPGSRSKHFGQLLQNPKLQLMASLSSNHSLDLYFPKSLGPSKDDEVLFSALAQIFSKENGGGWPIYKHFDEL